MAIVLFSFKRGAEKGVWDLRMRCYYLNISAQDLLENFQEFRAGIYNHRRTGYLYRWRFFRKAGIYGLEIIPPLTYKSLLKILDEKECGKYAADDRLGAKLAIQEDYSEKH